MPLLTRPVIVFFNSIALVNSIVLVNSIALVNSNFVNADFVMSEFVNSDLVYSDLVCGSIALVTTLFIALVTALVTALVAALVIVQEFTTHGIAHEITCFNKPSIFDNQSWRVKSDLLRLSHWHVNLYMVVPLVCHSDLREFLELVLNTIWFAIAL